MGKAMVRGSIVGMGGGGGGVLWGGWWIVGGVEKGYRGGVGC